MYSAINVPFIEPEREAYNVQELANSGTLEYNQAGVHSHKRPEMDFAKIIN